MSLEGIQPQQFFAARFFWVKIDSLIVLLSYLLGSIPFGYIVAQAHGDRYPAARQRQYRRDQCHAGPRQETGLHGFRLRRAEGAAGGDGRQITSRDHFAADRDAAHDHVSRRGHGSSLMPLTSSGCPESIGAISAAITCIIGHNFPVWLGFKGGKGMATSAGVLIGMMPLRRPWAACWSGRSSFFSTRYVSLASIAAAIALPVITMILLLTGFLYGWPYFYFAVAACLLAVWRHRSNIVRLMNGTENRFVKKAKAVPPPDP